MIKITKVRRRNITISLVILPFFLLGAGWAGFSGFWSLAIGIMVVWGIIFLWLTSYLFMAFTIFIGSIFAFSQGYWLLGLGGLLLTGYLYFASRMTDKDMEALPGRMRAISPTTADTFEKIMDPRRQRILVGIIVVLSIIITAIVFWLMK